MHGEVRHFGTVEYIVHFWLIWYQNYLNQLIFAKVVGKSLLPHFFMDHGVVARI